MVAGEAVEVMVAAGEVVVAAEEVVVAAVEVMVAAREVVVASGETIRGIIMLAIAAHRVKILIIITVC